MTTTKQRPSEQITETVTSWPGVEAGPGRRGEFAFRVDGKEIGHLHGDHAAHFGFPRDVGAALREAGRVGPHPVNPHSDKLAARRIETDDDVQDVIALMRENYERIVGGGRGPAGS
jgi:luciferase-like monooxygenase